jgi:hypothetical protein
MIFIKNKNTYTYTDKDAYDRIFYSIHTKNSIIYLNDRK